MDLWSGWHEYIRVVELSFDDLISSHVYDDVVDFLMLWAGLDVDLHGLMLCWSCGKLVLPASYLTILLHFDFLSWWVSYGQALLMFMLGMSAWYYWFMRFWFHEKEFMVGFHLEHPRGGSSMWFWFGLWKLIYWQIDDYWRCFGMCMSWLAMWAGSMWYPSHLWLGVGWDLYILILCWS